MYWMFLYGKSFSSLPVISNISMFYDKYISFEVSLKLFTIRKRQLSVSEKNVALYPVLRYICFSL